MLGVFVSITAEPVGAAPLAQMSKIPFVRWPHLLVLFVSAMLLSSCALLYDDLSPKPGDPRKDPKSVTVLWALPSQKYTVLSKAVSFDRRTDSRAQIEDRLRRSAAMIGGDAVIILSFGEDQNPSYMRATFLVIRWAKQLLPS